MKLLAQADDEVEPTVDDLDETSPLLPGADSQYDGAQGSSHVPPEITVSPVNMKSSRPTPQRANSKFYNSFPNSPNMSRVNLSIISEGPSTSSTVVSPTPPDTDSVNSDSDLEDIQPPNTLGNTLPTHSTERRARGTTPASTPSKFRAFVHRSRKRVYKGWLSLNDFMTVPLWAALASLLVACVRPLQHALEMHMQPVKGAVASAGNCSIPVTLVVLGAYFYHPKEEGPHKDSLNQNGNGRHRPLSTTKSNASLLHSVREMFGKSNSTKQSRSAPQKSRPGETKTVIIAVASRMIVTPMILLPFMALSARFDLHAIFEE